MNPDYVALGVMVLPVLSVLVAWWYASRPVPVSNTQRLLAEMNRNLEIYAATLGLALLPAMNEYVDAVGELAKAFERWS